MAALFTAPPELTCGNPEKPQNNDLFFKGASKQIYNYSGKTFTANLATRDTDNSSCTHPLVCKRGSPWTLPDSATFQQMIDDVGYSMAGLSVCQSGSKFYFIGAVPNPGYLIYIPFDMSSETYDYLPGLGSGTINPYWITGNHSSYPALQPLSAALSDGRLIVVWSEMNTSGVGPSQTRNSKFTFVTSDVFAAASAFITAPVSSAINIVSLCVDASDTTHVFYIETAATKLWHCTISSGGSVGTPDLVEDFSSGFYVFAPGVLFNGNLTFAACKFSHADVVIFESDPSTISWTKKVVATKTGSSVNEAPCVAVVGSNLYIGWIENHASAYPAVCYEVWYSIYDGSTFTSKDEAWDTGNNQYSGTGIATPGDTDAHYCSMEYNGSKLQLLGWSEFTNGYDETELYLELALGSPVGSRGPRNKFY